MKCPSAATTFGARPPESSALCTNGSIPDAPIPRTHRGPLRRSLRDLLALDHGNSPPDAGAGRLPDRSIDRLLPRRRRTGPDRRGVAGPLGGHDLRTAGGRNWRDFRGVTSASVLPARLAASFLDDPAVRAVFDAVGVAGDEVRIIGGAVRDAILGRNPREIDYATTALPATVARRGEAAGMRAVPTGIDHGTVTLVTDGRPFEVTTLREDVETDGRHAVVRFGRDWTADALRRDFSINALSVEADGTLHDPAGGYGDILNRRIRFIGDADTRIAEDRLRLLRFFRFHAQLGFGAFDADGLSAAIRARAGLRDLAAERIGQEMRKLLLGSHAVPVVAAMQDAGILEVVLGIAYPVQLRRLVAFEAAAEIDARFTRRLAALGARVVEDVDRVALRLRLSNAERDGMAAAVTASTRLDPPPPPDELRRAAYQLGAEGIAGGLAQAVATGGGPILPWVAAFRSIQDWPVPQLPVSGADLLAAGMRPGPAIGAVLRTLEEWWIGEGFAPDRVALIRRMQQIVASQQ
ncbi:MAG: CCA tRNA nucleotidyltransferase [Bauldia sp.]|nr:CCA tRNA nucleotidyltransferase [Bauldia sp.]